MARSSPLRVVVAGGGIAGVEALLALRDLAGDRCALTLIAPQAEFVVRALAVAEPFGLGERRRVPLAEIARDTGARLVTGTLAGVDDRERVVTLGGGGRVGYDALLLATGARAVPALPGALSWDDTSAADVLAGVLRDLESGAIRRLAVVAPAGAGWPLPAYELALLLARRARGVGAEPEIALVAADATPLAPFGATAGVEIAAELEAAGVRFEGGVRAEAEPSRPGELVLRPSGRRLRADRVLALPRLVGRPVDGVPADPDGFVPVDAHGRVPGLERVWAAGDGAAFPIKHGGLAAAEADAAAMAIARLTGADVVPEPFRPVLRGELLSGRGVRPVSAGDPQPAAPAAKLSGRWLAPYLAARDEERRHVAAQIGYPQVP